MKLTIACTAIALLVLGAALSAQQKTEDGCNFALSGTPVKPNITGPEEILAMAHVVDQPDSPVEIVSADFTGSFVAISNEQFTERLDCSIKVRNRSDRAVRSFNAITGFTPGGVGIPAFSGFGATSDQPQGRSLIPGEELEIKACGGGGNGGAPGNRVRLLVAVENVALNGCLYIPSRRFAF